MLGSSHLYGRLALKLAEKPKPATRPKQVLAAEQRRIRNDRYSRLLVVSKDIPQKNP